MTKAAAVARHPSTKPPMLGEDTQIITLQQLALFGVDDKPKRYRLVRGPKRVHLMLVKD